MPLRQCPKCHRHGQIPSNKTTCCLGRGGKLSDATPPLRSELVEPKNGYARHATVPPVQKPPTGWEPHVDITGDTASLVSEATSRTINQDSPSFAADERFLIEQWNLNPDAWMISGPLNCRRWPSSVPVEAEPGHIGADCQCVPQKPGRHHERRWLHYYKASLVRRAEKGRTPDIQAIIDEIAGRELPAKVERPEGDLGFCVFLADSQMGKGDGDGAEGTANRLLNKLDAIEQRIIDLRLTGRELETLYLCGMGDLVEGCDGHYPMQAFRTTLNRRDQVKVMRRIIVKYLQRLAPLFSKVVATAVPGNHGENRKDGKAFTDFADNDDVAIFEQAQEILSERPEFEHVRFVIPKEDPTVTLDVHGTVLGLTHGHTFRPGTTKAVEWWMKQGHGQQPIGNARVLVTAHYHHFAISAQGAKTHMQCPAMDGGSDWYKYLSGDDSPPGILTCVMGDTASERGWSHQEIL